MEYNLDELNIPAHVAVILDGNGRWAKMRNKPRSMGHVEGCKVAERIVEDAARIGIKYFTMYGFSTENWNRSADEVGALMKLFRYYIKRLLVIAKKNNVRVLMIGERNRFERDLIDGINKAENETKDNTGMTLVIALNYGSRDEMIRAMKKMGNDLLEKKIKIDDIRESLFENYLDTRGIPDPDLLIRTSGEQRLSNYLLWQMAYTEFYFTDVLWPDFNKDELIKAIAKYNKRDRRFGGVK